MDIVYVYLFWSKFIAICWYYNKLRLCFRSDDTMVVILYIFKRMHRTFLIEFIAQCTSSRRHQRNMKSKEQKSKIIGWEWLIHFKTVKLWASTNKIHEVGLSGLQFGTNLLFAVAFLLLTTESPQRILFATKGNCSGSQSNSNSIFVILRQA